MRKPSEILADMERKCQCKGAYRDGNKVCFNGAIMKEWGLFNNSGGVEIFQYQDVLMKVLTDMGENPISGFVINELACFNDKYPFSKGKQKAIKFLQELGL